MKFPAYPKYKDSGVEWLGEVPEHWEVLALKHIVSTPITDGPHETPEFVDEGIPFVSAEAVAKGFIDFSKIRGFISKSDHVQYCKKYRPELFDIYMVKSGATTGVTAIVDTDKDFNIWSPLAVIRCDIRVYPRFVLNFMRSINFLEAIALYWSFGTQQNIGMGVIGNLTVTVPPLPEQRTIAAFLDVQTTKLDTLITKKRELIEKLKEKRAALITRTVTRGLPPEAAKAAGLDPHPKMKDSGVEWLGEVPEHWKVKRLKHYIQHLNSGASVNSDNMPTEDDSPGILKTSCVYGDVFRPEENKRVVEEEINRVFCPVLGDSLIISRMNTPDLVGSCGYVAQSLPHLYLPDRLWITHFANKNKSFPKFFWYRIISRDIKEQISSLATGTSGSMKNLMQESFLSIAVAIPSLPEQRAIAAYLDRETAAIDALVAKVEAAIERLQEYRSALITAAVTGKIDVREANS
jgi:type I restriction enzyme, S subunit